MQVFMGEALPKASDPDARLGLRPDTRDTEQGNEAPSGSSLSSMVSRLTPPPCPTCSVFILKPYWRAQQCAAQPRHAGSSHLVARACMKASEAPVIASEAKQSRSRRAPRSPWNAATLASSPPTTTAIQQGFQPTSIDHQSRDSDDETVDLRRPDACRCACELRQGLRDRYRPEYRLRHRRGGLRLAE